MMRFIKLSIVKLSMAVPLKNLCFIMWSTTTAAA